MANYLSNRTRETEGETMTTAAQRPSLSLVQDQPETAVDTAPAPMEGTVVEHQGQRNPGRSVELATRVKGHAVGNHLYVTWVARGYAQLFRRWLEAYRDDYPQMIASAKEELRAAKGDTDAETRAKALVRERRAEYREHRKWHLIKTGSSVAAMGGGVAAGALTGGALVDVAMGTTATLVGAWHGRPTAFGDPEALLPGVDAHGELTAPVIGGEALLEALKAIRVPDGSSIVSVTPGPDDTSVTVVNLPPNFTVTSLRNKAEELAGALGRDTTMVDITKAAHANQASIWLASVDPFEAPRRSPVIEQHLAVDAFRAGVPVAWGKRGNTIFLPVNNANFLIAGMTRSGKGVGAANLVAGAALDVRINLRIVAGKNNGEWDPAAKAGVAATYFKPDPYRLNELLKAEWADKDRREQILGEAGKSKMTEAMIEALGGIEVLVIDEVATYTRSGTPMRDENLKLLTDLSAVAAAAGILIVLITQYPEVDVIPQGLAMNCGTRWAMRVDNATQSNAILGGSASSSGRDASKFDPPRPGLGWLVNPFAGVTDLARSFDLDEDERGEVSALMKQAAALREEAGRLVGQWDDPIERHLVNATGLSSAAGGPKGNGQPGRQAAFLSDEQRQQLAAVKGALAAMEELGRDVAQLDEMAALMGAGMSGDRLGELLRAAGAGGTVKITVPGRSARVNGYRAADIREAASFLEGA